MPILMFAIMFGLSMDYEVFLLSRIRERYDVTRHRRQHRARRRAGAGACRTLTPPGDQPSLLSAGYPMPLRLSSAVMTA
jgi:uncharacterized membrane protein YdfJ with MMPL/SSD domain